MKFTAILVIALLCTNTLCVEMEVEVKKSPQQVLMQLKETGWGKLAVSMLEMQLRTGGPLDELITAFRNLWENLTFKINSENADYRRNKGEHDDLKKEIMERQTESRVRMGVSTAKLQNTLYPEEATLEATIADAEDLIAQSQATIDQANHERDESQTLFEEESAKINDAIDAVSECISLMTGLQQGSVVLADINYAKRNTKQLLNNLKIKNNPELKMVKTLMEMSQDWADAEATQQVLDLLHQLLPKFLDELQNIVDINDQEIELHNNVLTTQQAIIDGAQERLDNANRALVRVQAKITEEQFRLQIAQEDNDKANLDFDTEEARWATEQAAHDDLLAELEAELDALNQCIDLFSSPQMAAIGDDMLDSLNS